MANLKIIKVTGSPFASGLEGQLGYHVQGGEFKVWGGVQFHGQGADSEGSGWHYASYEEMKGERWAIFNDVWNPEVGDYVCEKTGITPEYLGVITEVDGLYITIKTTRGTSVYANLQNFMCAPVGLWKEISKIEGTSVESKTKDKPEEEVKIRFKTEAEFKRDGQWISNLRGGYPETWNSDREMNNFMGNYYTIPKRYLKSESFRFKNWTFKPNQLYVEGTPEYDNIYDAESKPSEIRIRFKTEEEFKRDKEWKGNAPFGWCYYMLEFLGTTHTIPNGENLVEEIEDKLHWSFSRSNFYTESEDSFYNSEKAEALQKLKDVKKEKEEPAEAYEHTTTKNSCKFKIGDFVKSLDGYIGIVREIKRENEEGVTIIGVDLGRKFTGHYLDIDMSEKTGWYIAEPNLKHYYYELNPEDYPSSKEFFTKQPDKKGPEMKEKRFKVGDKVTYKSKDECIGGHYEYGGSDMAGLLGTIVEYLEYEPENNCYKIKVTAKHGNYGMLESEFKEWDNPSYSNTFGIPRNAQASGMYVPTSGGLYGGSVSHGGTSFSAPVGSTAAGYSITNPYIEGIYRSPETSKSSYPVDEVGKYYQKPNLLNIKKRKKQLVVLNQKTI